MSAPVLGAAAAVCGATAGRIAGVDTMVFASRLPLWAATRAAASHWGLGDMANLVAQYSERAGLGLEVQHVVLGTPADRHVVHKPSPRTRTPVLALAHPILPAHSSHTRFFPAPGTYSSVSRGCSARMRMLAVNPVSVGHHAHGAGRAVTPSPLSRTLSNSAVDRRVLWNQLPELVKG